MVDNIEIAKQLKKLQEDMNALVEAQTKQLRAQSSLVKQISDAYQALNQPDAIQNLEATTKALEKAAESAQKTGESASTMEKMTASIAAAAAAQNKLGTESVKTMNTLTGFSAITGILSGFVVGLNSSWQAMKLFSGVASTTIEALGQFALSIITFPFKLLTGLIDFASQGGGGSGLRQEIENIRKSFGDLRKSSAAAVMEMGRNLKGELANTGLRVWRIFGNLAERLKFMREYAENIGPVFANLADQFTANTEAIGAYFKGLHLTAEGQKAVSVRAFALGEELTEVTRQITNYSIQMADEFGLSAAQVSSDVGDMMADFRNFGGMAPRVLTQISIYARRLGIEVKGLLGVIDQFDNFEGAARSAAQLTQAFGLQLDALELLKAQDPAARTEMLRKAFFAAGRSVENMTRQERALLQQQTGLADSALDLVFSAKNQGISYDEVRKKSESAAKSQLTQEEALQKLAGAIERLVKSGSIGSGGFFERFFQGFERGIIRSQEFRKLMMSIRIALRETYWAGAQVGRMFVDLFPGIQDLIGGLGDLFNVSRFREMLGTLKNIFRTFFTGLTKGNGPESVKNFLGNLKSMFFDYFNKSSPAGARILKGAQSFLRAFSEIAGGVLRAALTGIADAVRALANFIKGGGVDIPTDGFTGFVMELINPLMEAIVDSWPAIKDAFTQLFDAVWPHVRDFLADNALYITAFLFGPAVVRSLATGIAAPIAASFTKGMMDGATKGVNAGMKAIQSSLTGIASKGTSSAAAALAGAPAAVGSTNATAAAAAASPVNPMTNARLLMIAGVILVGMVAILAGIAALAEYARARHLSTEQMLTAAGVMAIAGLVMVELGGAVALVAQAGTLIQANLAGAVAGLAAVGIFGAAMTVGIIAIVNAFADFQPAQLTNAIAAMTAGGIFIAAAAAVLIAATAIGVAFIGSGGTAAIAAAVGLATIATVTAMMTESLTDIIDEISALRVTSGFQQKLDVFTTVLEAVTGFGSMVADIATATSHSSLWGFVTGSGADDHVNTLKALRETISDITLEMRGIVSNVLAQVRTLETAPADLQKAELFAQIMAAIGTMVSNFRPPDSLFANEGLFTSGIDERLDALGAFVVQLSTSLREVIRSVVSEFGNIVSGANFTAEARSNFEAVNSILSTVGNLGRSMLIVINQSYSGLTAEELRARLPVVTEVIVSMMQTLFSGGGGGMIAAMGDLVSQMVTAISSINDNDARRLSTLGPVLVSAFEAIGTIANTVAGLGVLVEDIPAASRGESLGTLRVIVGTMLYGIRDIISTLIDSTRDLFSGLSPAQANAIKAGVSTIASLIESVGTMPSTLTGLVEALGNGTFDYATVRARLGTITSLFQETDNDGNPGLPVLFRTAATAFNNIPEITGNPAAKLEQLSKSLSSISEVSSLRFEGIAEGVTANAEFIRSGALAQMGENIKAMIAEVNSIAADLGSIEPININTQLTALAGRLGLGSSEEITIRNRDFNINVALEVHVDARELENVLLDRPNTRILSSG